MQGALAEQAAGAQDLDDVELAAVAVPARAGSVLGRARDLGVKHPDGGHVAVEARVAVERHGEFEEEDLGRAAEAVVGDGAWADIAARVAVRAADVGHDGEFLV